ncbi:MAG TPA: glycine betaine ABC transporter substrate-binding protein [Acidimicrobiales bacterium]|nr:glycine betaine ABC transporter substrate-binding protein [Acidimicrobiales bacterium]
MQLFSKLPSHPAARAAAGFVAVALTVVACSSSSKSASSCAASSGGSSATGTVASQLSLGGPAECQTNAYCIPGLQKTYGITFKSFKTLDADGPLTYQALTSGGVDVGEVFSTDAQVLAHNLVVLNDDKHLQAADNITPVIATPKATSGVTKTVNNVSGKLTTVILLGLNKLVGVDHQDPQAVADNWLKSEGLNGPSTNATGQSITIAAFNFSESDLLAYIYGDALKAAGASVTVKPDLGTRQTLEPGLQSGQFSMLIEYAASALEFLNHSAGVANGDINNNISHLKALMTPKNITVLNAAPAVDTNAFAVTQATAAKYHLSTMSDLSKKA